MKEILLLRTPGNPVQRETRCTANAGDTLLRLLGRNCTQAGGRSNLRSSLSLYLRSGPNLADRGLAGYSGSALYAVDLSFLFRCPISFLHASLPSAITQNRPMS